MKHMKHLWPRTALLALAMLALLPAFLTEARADGGALSVENYTYSAAAGCGFDVVLPGGGTDDGGQAVAAVYSVEGQLCAVRTYSAADTIHISLPDVEPDQQVKVFWLSANGVPLAEAVGFRAETGPDQQADPESNGDVFAVLYADGEMVFQRDDAAEAGREVAAAYKVDLDGYKAAYSAVGGVQQIRGSTAPWNDERTRIHSITFSAKVQPRSTAFWFYGCSNLTEIRSIEKLDTSNVTDMQYMFNMCQNLSSLDVSRFKTENVTNMANMFAACNSLTALDVKNFNTSRVTDMSSMFDECRNLLGLDLTNFDTSKVKNMRYMFSGCERLTELDLSQFNTSKVTNMYLMFCRCTSLKKLNLSGFDTSGVLTMDSMFSSCKSLEVLDLTTFNTAKVTTIGGMFSDCSSLTTIYASGAFVMNQTTCSTSMFYGCTSLKGGAGTKYNKNRVGGQYARIDGGTTAPGYFTAKAD